MSNDGGLQWYWILVIVFAVIAVSSCLFLIWCCRRPKLLKAPLSPIPTSPSLTSSLHRSHPLPESPGLYRPSDFRPWSHSLTSPKSDTDRPLHRPHSLPESPGLYRPSFFRQSSHSMPSHDSDTDHPNHRPHSLPESPGLYRPSFFRQSSHSMPSHDSDTDHPNHRPHPLPESPGLYRPFRHSMSSQKSDPGHSEAHVPFIPLGP